MNGSCKSHTQKDKDNFQEYSCIQKEFKHSFSWFLLQQMFPTFLFLTLILSAGFFFLCVFEPYNFSRNPLKGLKCKYYTKSLFASKLHDPRYDLLSGFPLVSMNNQLAGRRVGDLAFVRRNLQNKTNQQR